MPGSAQGPLEGRLPGARCARGPAPQWGGGPRATKAAPGGRPEASQKEWEGRASPSGTRAKTGRCGATERPGQMVHVLLVFLSK